MSGMETGEMTYKTTTISAIHRGQLIIHISITNSKTCANCDTSDITPIYEI